MLLLADASGGDGPAVLGEAPPSSSSRASGASSSSAGGVISFVDAVVGGVSGVFDGVGPLGSPRRPVEGEALGDAFPLRDHTPAVWRNGGAK